MIQCYIFIVIVKSEGVGLKLMMKFHSACYEMDAEIVPYIVTQNNWILGCFCKVKEFDMEIARGLFVIVLTISVAHYGCGQSFNPTITTDSCTKSKLVLTVSDAADNGIIYIQGQGAACKQTTSAGNATTHEFDFGSCGIQWEKYFKIIVQKKSLYQTGEDKQIPIMCIADLSDITADNNGIDILDKTDDAGQNLTIKPTATMKIYNSGIEVSNSNVQLTDLLTMAVQLDSEFIQDFDIKAVECTASTIPIISNSCSTDTELFPQFSHPSQGVLSSTFGAFRTTDLNGGSVTMTFSCNLKVCLGSCVPEVCGDGNNGYGRKKRSLHSHMNKGIVKRQTNPGSSPVIDDIYVGSTLRVSTEKLVVKDDKEQGATCIDDIVFIAIAAALVVVMALMSLAACVAYIRLRNAQGLLKKYKIPSSSNKGLPTITSHDY